ncbi:MAG: TRAP transporter substrate-binding protein DctP, partial [Verrucomicrobiota bacterium]|nr:TRAP transporter substrate-binding protein DctP [Verrucomicrobiota bacterium]
MALQPYPTCFVFRLKMGWILWLVSCLLLGCRPESDIKVLRLAHTLDTTHPVHAALVFMAKELETRSAGRMRIKIYPGSQLGSERETIELLQLGAVDLVKTSTSPLEGFIPGMGVFGIPYVFRGSEHF